MTLPLLRAPSAMPKPHRVQTLPGFAIRTGFAPEFILSDVEGRAALPSLLFAVALPFKTDEVEEVEGFPFFSFALSPLPALPAFATVSPSVDLMREVREDRAAAAGRERLLLQRLKDTILAPHRVTLVNVRARKNSCESGAPCIRRRRTSRLASEKGAERKPYDFRENS